MKNKVHEMTFRTSGGKMYVLCTHCGRSASFEMRKVLTERKGYLYMEGEARKALRRFLFAVPCGQRIASTFALIS